MFRYGWGGIGGWGRDSSAWYILAIGHVDTQASVALEMGGIRKARVALEMGGWMC